MAFWRLLARFDCLLVVFVAVALTTAVGQEIGIGRSGLSQQNTAVQEKTLEDIRRLGAKLSQINLEKFTRRFQSLLAALKAADLTIDAVEFGNEDDSYYYDADVPYDHYAMPDELRTWLHGYGDFLKAGAEVLHDLRYYPHAKIVTFGIAHGCDQCAGPPRHLSNPARVVAMLKDVNGFNYLDNARYHVDGYGTHVYASPNDIAGSVAHTLHEDAVAFGRARPLWITEWGFQDLKAFPNNKGQPLSQGLQAFLSEFDTLRGQISIGPMMFYRFRACPQSSSTIAETSCTAARKFRASLS